MSILITAASPLPQIEYAASSITSSYTLAGSFFKSVSIMLIVSTLDQPVQVSFDGTNDHIAVPAGSTVPVFIPIDFKSNGCFFSNVNVFVKEIGNPSTGSLYVSAFTS